MEEKEEKKEKKKRSRKNKILRRVGIVFACLLALVLVLVGVVYAVFMRYYNMTEYVKDDDVSTIALEDLENDTDEDDDSDGFYIYEDVTDADGEVIGQTQVSVDLDSLTDEERESIEARVKEELAGASDEQQEALDLVASGQLYLPAEEAQEDVLTVDKSTVYDEYEVITDEDGNIISLVKDGVTYTVVSDNGTELIITKNESTDTTATDAELVSVDTSSQNSVYNLLLIGTDLRAGQSGYGRSDTMILVSINNSDKEINMISFMRDLYADIPGYGVDKLNRAYKYGGGPLLVQTIEQNYGISIDNYAAVDFYSLVSIIDSIGGVSISVSADEAEVANKYIKSMCNDAGLDPSSYYITGSGQMLLNGMQAVGYCRIRSTGASDYARTQRQRAVLLAMFNTLKTQSVSQINTFLNTALPCVTHNIPSSTVVSLMANAPTYLGYTVNQYRVPFDGAYSYSGEIIVPDFSYTISMLNSIIYY